MIRFGMVLWLAFALTAGVGLFQVKYEVQALEDKLIRLHRQILDDQEAIHVLRAEWSYLNEPARLSELAQRYLEMAPMAAAQLTRFEALPAPLPVPPRRPAFLATPGGAGTPAGHRPEDQETPDGRSPEVGPARPDAAGAVVVSSRTSP